MAVLLSDDWQAHGLLRVIFGGACVTGTCGTGGDVIWLYRGIGLSLACGSDKTFGAGLYHHGAGYSRYSIFPVCAGGTRSGF